MLTYETVKWTKGYYITTRINGRAISREWFKTRTAVDAQVKALRAKGYKEA